MAECNIFDKQYQYIEVKKTTKYKVCIFSSWLYYQKNWVRLLFTSIPYSLIQTSLLILHSFPGTSVKQGLGVLPFVSENAVSHTSKEKCVVTDTFPSHMHTKRIKMLHSIAVHNVVDFFKKMANTENFCSFTAIYIILAWTVRIMKLKCSKSKNFFFLYLEELFCAIPHSLCK